MKLAYCPPYTRCDCPSCIRALNTRFNAIVEGLITPDDSKRIAKDAFAEFGRVRVMTFLNNDEPT